MDGVWSHGEVWRSLAAGTCLVMAACSSSEQFGTDGAIRADGAMALDATVSADGHIVGGDGSDPDLGLPPAPTAGLQSLVDDASGVLLGTSTALEVDAASEELVVGGETWTVYYDLATLELSESLGTATATTQSLKVRLAPTHCQGRAADGSPIPGTISRCTGRTEANTVSVHARILGFLHFSDARRELSYGIPVVGGAVSYSSIENPPQDRSEAAAWSIVVARWMELGRGR
ncbi:MAG: hypothetical protein U1E65_22850 [Myxococcota bacterium]